MRIGSNGVSVSRDDVTRAYLAGGTIAEIANHYGVSTSTMRRFTHSTGVPVRPMGCALRPGNLSSERARELAIRGAALRRGSPTAVLGPQ